MKTVMNIVSKSFPNRGGKQIINPTHILRKGDYVDMGWTPVCAVLTIIWNFEEDKTTIGVIVE